MRNEFLAGRAAVRSKIEALDGAPLHQEGAPPDGPREPTSSPPYSADADADYLEFTLNSGIRPATGTYRINRSVTVTLWNGVTWQLGHRLESEGGVMEVTFHRLSCQPSSEHEHLFGDMTWRYLAADAS